MIYAECGYPDTERARRPQFEDEKREIRLNLNPSQCITGEGRKRAVGGLYFGIEDV